MPIVILAAMFCCAILLITIVMEGTKPGSGRWQ